MILSQKFSLYQKICVLCDKPATGEYRELSMFRLKTYAMCCSCAAKCIQVGIDNVSPLIKKLAEDNWSGIKVTTIENIDKAVAKKQNKENKKYKKK